jgi:hypothetical protein
MPRTRDFLLIALSIGFLVLTITSTLIATYAPDEPDTTENVIFADSEVDIQGGETPDTVALSRAERRERLRQQIASQADLFIFEGDTETVPEEASDTVVTEPLRCATYLPYIQPWQPADHTFRTVEGARVLFRKSVTNVSTSTAQLDEVAVAVLPIMPRITGTPNCLPSDIIGFTPNGALIRNSDTALYQAVPEETLIGFALDGFPLYGASAGTRDACGGRTVAGLYRYQVNTTGSTLLNCFSATPANLQ